MAPSITTRARSAGRDPPGDPRRPHLHSKMERPTPAQIQMIIAQARSERSRVLGELLSRGLHAAGRTVRAVVGVFVRTAAEAAAMRNARTPQHLRMKLHQHQSAAH
jgi:hypothetical protein